MARRGGGGVPASSRPPSVPPAGPVVVAQESWTGTDGTAWPAQWTMDASAGGTNTIVGNRGRMTLGTAGGYADASTAILDLPSADFEFILDYKIGAITESFPVIQFRGEPTGANHYQITFYPYLDAIDFARQTANANDTGYPVSKSGLTFVVGDTWRVRVRCVGSSLKARYWNTAVVEPTTWDVNVTDATYATQTQFQLSFTGGNTGIARIAEWDNFTVYSIVGPPPQIVIASETWTGADGDPWPAQWDLNSATTGGANTIVTNRGRMTLGTVGSYSDANTAGLTLPSADFEFVVDFKIGTLLESYPQVRFRGDNSVGNHFQISISPVNNTISLMRQTGNANDVGYPIDKTVAFVLNDIWRIRVICVGSSIKARYWNTSGAEPTTWDVDTTDATYSAQAYFTLIFVSGAASAARLWEWDNLTVYSASTSTGGGTVGGSGVGGSIPALVRILEAYHEGAAFIQDLITKNVTQGAEFHAGDAGTGANGFSTTEKNLVKDNDLPFMYFAGLPSSVSAPYPSSYDAAAAATILDIVANDPNPHVYLYPAPEFDNGGSWKTQPVPNRPAPTSNDTTTLSQWMAYYQTQLGFNSAPISANNPGRGYKIMCTCSFTQSVYYAFDLGFDGVLLERNIDEIPGITPGLAFIRGAASMNPGKTWGLESSMYRTYAGPSGGAPTQYNSSGVQTGGWSPEYFKRSLYHMWAGGAPIMFYEAIDLSTGALSNPYGLNPTGATAKAFGDYAVAASSTRGIPQAPFAILQDHTSGFEPKGGPYGQGDYKWYSSIPYNAADHRLADLLAMIFPNYNTWGTAGTSQYPSSPQTPSAWTTAWINGTAKNYEPQGTTRWGEQFDVITDRASLTCLQKYRVVIVTATPSPGLTALLNSYTASGGVVLTAPVTAAQIDSIFSTYSTVSVAGPACVWLVGLSPTEAIVTILNTSGSTWTGTVTHGITGRTSSPSIPPYDVAVVRISTV